MSNTHNGMRIPSLRAIQALEAAARMGSFTEAAQELNVTQGAISRQIQELERQLNVEFFVRAGPKLTLTKAGHAFAVSAERALDILCQAVRAAKDPQTTSYVTLSMLPSVAAKWLAPRLGRFVNQHPDIDLRVSASRHVVNFETEGVDAAIRYGVGNYPGLDVELLGREMVFPVCSPDYASRHDLTDPAKLLHSTLFHAEIEEDWGAWFDKAGVVCDTIPRGPTLGDEATILQAVVDGQGVALGRTALVADDLATGRLIAPFTIELQASFSYWFVMPANIKASQSFVDVKKWIQDEFHNTGFPQA